MPTAIDRIGEIHDTWKVVEKLPSRKGKTYWKCVCIRCNNVKEIQGGNLRKGAYAKCPCLTGEEGY